MTRRRKICDPLTEFRHKSHWLTVSDMQHGVLESTPLEQGTDLHAALARALERLRADGWTIEGGGKYGYVHVNQRGVRRFVHVRPTDPET